MITITTTRIVVFCIMFLISYFAYRTLKRHRRIRQEHEEQRVRLQNLKEAILKEAAFTPGVDYAAGDKLSAGDSSLTVTGGARVLDNANGARAQPLRPPMAIPTVTAPARGEFGICSQCGERHKIRVISSIAGALCKACATDKL